MSAATATAAAALMADRTSATPFVSVIVPTYNRAAVLPFLLAALGRQVYPSDRMELIVVDNSSSDDTSAVVERWAAVLPFPVQFHTKFNNGPAASRNLGAHRARGDVLAFTDSDCIPEPHWLRAATRGFELGFGIVCGPFLPAPRAGEPMIAAQQAPITSDVGCYPTANLFVRRQAFEDVGGFDEQFALYPWGELIAGEDADLAWRIRRIGERAHFSHRAIVRHLATPMGLGRLLLRPVVVQILPRLMPTIPELRDTYLWHRYFVSAMHFYFYLGALGTLVFAATTSWLPLVLWLPWLHYCVRHLFIEHARAEGWVGVARALIQIYIQVAAVAVLLVSSTRYRRLVL